MPFSKHVLYKSNSLSYSTTLSSTLNSPNKSASAPALTDSPVEMSTHPPAPAVVELLPSVEMDPFVAAPRERLSAAKVSSAR